MRVSNLFENLDCVLESISWGGRSYTLSAYWEVVDEKMYSSYIVSIRGLFPKLLCLHP